MSFDDAISTTTSALDLSPQPNGGRPAMAEDDAPPAAVNPQMSTGAFNPLDYPLALAAPLRLTQTADWHQHIPFAFALVEMLRPRTYVELGVYRGDSFCAVCQAIDSLGLPTTCVAVDTWAGDIHTGHYADTVYDDLFSHVRERYASFATLWRMTFDNAVGEVEDGSIDLLHIDGTHTYEAVRHDFDNWLSKLSPRGVVILHDVNEHQENFGVYRLWDEISQRYPSCEFLYGHGLGVAAVGAEPPQPLLDFLAAMRDNPSVARYFQILGERVLRMGQEDALSTARAQVAEQGDEIRRLRDAAAALEMQTSVYAGELALLSAESTHLAQQHAGQVQSLSIQRDSQKSVYLGEVGRLTAENAELAQRCATFEEEIQSLNAQLYSLRVSRVYRASRIMAWPLSQAKRALRKARG